MTLFDKISRLNIVFDRLKNLCQEDEDFANLLTESIDEMLEDWKDKDVFGTEGQTDPRGDQRDDVWNMYHVEGFDD